MNSTGTQNVENVIQLMDLLKILSYRKKTFFVTLGLFLIVSLALVFKMPVNYTYGQVLEAGSYTQVDGTRAYIDNNYALITKIKTVFIPQLIQNASSLTEKQIWANMQFSSAANTNNIVAVSLVAGPDLENILQQKMLPQLLNIVLADESLQTFASQNLLKQQIATQQATVAQTTQYVSALTAKLQALGLIPTSKSASSNEATMVEQSLNLQNASSLQMGLLSLLNQQRTELSNQVSNLQLLQQTLSTYVDAHYAGNISVSNQPAGMPKVTLIILTIIFDLVAACGFIFLLEAFQAMRLSLRNSSA